MPEQDPMEFYKQTMAELDELRRRYAEIRGIPVEELRPYRRVPRPKDRPKVKRAKPEPTPEQRAAREAAIAAFQRLTRNPGRLH